MLTLNCSERRKKTEKKREELITDMSTSFQLRMMTEDTLKTSSLYEFPNSLPMYNPNPNCRNPNSQILIQS